MSVDFITNFFHKLPNDCQINILKQVDFRPLPLFKKGDCVNLISNDSSLFYVKSSPIWDSTNFTWVYPCLNPKFMAGVTTFKFSEDKIVLKEYTKGFCKNCYTTLDERGDKRCVDCGHNLCDSCYSKVYDENLPSYIIYGCCKNCNNYYN